jgi:hypothetical protein
MLTFAAPAANWDWIAPLPNAITVKKKVTADAIDFIHLFAADKKIFEREFKRLKKGLRKDGMLWVSWPKKSSTITTDLDENVIRNFGLANGLVDVKVCAIDETWSGLKFVFRLKDR